MMFKTLHKISLAAVLVACAVAASVADAAKPETPSVVVLGIDGMDPLLLRQYVDRGRMPHFKRLMDEGWYSPLGTSVPPQSPVAWANFITGMDAGGHGIFDFIHRDPKTYMPLFSAAEVSDPEKVLRIGDWVIPISKGETVNLRKGVAFWQVLDAHDVPYNIFRVPSNFPPVESKQKTLSGMGTPDLLGTYGTFSFYTDDPLWKEIDVSGGEVYLVKVEGHNVQTELVGPANSLRRDRPKLTVPMRIDVDPENDTAFFKVGNHRFILRSGEWSDWVRLEFSVMGPFKKLRGIVQFHLRSISPHLELYATAINLDPFAPALPISTPSGYAAELARQIGPYFTQGMPEDTKAYEHGMLTEDEFVTQVQMVMAEHWRMLDAVLDEYDGGLLFFYVSSIDQSSHMLWRNPGQSASSDTSSTPVEDHIESLYVEVDSMLAVVQSRIPKDAVLIVMSDHGFAPYSKRFHLNTWLYRNGYLALIRPDEIERHPLLGNVFWRRTKAYGLGINGLYLNVLGREAKGIVRAGAEYDSLVDEISRKLLGERDPETGEPIITSVDKRSEVYHGDEAANAPDLIVGYNRGYRCSDESALGSLTTEVLGPNLGKWGADHCIDHNLVPGILLANRAITVDDPDLKDLPTTFLALFGIAPHPQMRGRKILATDPSVGAASAELNTKGATQ